MSSYGNRNTASKYYIDGHLLPFVDTIVDLGVHTDKTLNYSNYCNIICAKANARDNLILRSFHSRYVCHGHIDIDKNDLCCFLG